MLPVASADPFTNLNEKGVLAALSKKLDFPSDLSLTPIPCKPVLYDLAERYIVLPSAEEVDVSEPPSSIGKQVVSETVCIPHVTCRYYEKTCRLVVLMKAINGPNVLMISLSKSCHSDVKLISVVNLNFCSSVVETQRATK